MLLISVWDVENIFDKIMVKKLSNQTERNLGVKNGVDLRHKLLTQGKRAMSELDLLTLLLSHRGNYAFSQEKATRIIYFCENQLNEFSQWTMEELKNIIQLDDDSCILLLTVWELSNRRWRRNDPFPTIQKSTDAFSLFAPRLGHLTHEEFHVAFLNRANRVVNTLSVSKGGINATVVDLRIIFQKAILNKANSIIVAHNHPSGSLKPSNEDITLTQKIKEAAGYFDILLLDHLILSGDQYKSFADEGWL